MYRNTIPATCIAALLACGGASGDVAKTPAFPGAEGFGAHASGGRGGEVYYVTNLNDDGPGSLRDAVSKGNRMVLFRVSGTIQLKSRLTVNQPNITIAGQTAPGDGICLRDHELFITNTSNIVVRFLRVRPGDEKQKEHDALTIWHSGDVIIDHCSLSWSTDSINDVVKESGNVTVQWSILSEPLCRSVHSKGSHGYATGWDGRKFGGFSGHHNLIAHAASRAPRLGYHKNGRGLIDIRNNVIYNSGPSYGGEGDDFNFVANYYRPGPKDFRPDKALFHISADTARGYFAGNVYEGEPEISANNLKAIVMDAPVTMHVPKPDGSASDTSPATQPAGTLNDCLRAEPVEVAPVTTHKAEEAYELVLLRAGAILPRRDAVDQRIVKDVRDRTGSLINSQADVGGWPELKSAEAPADKDLDGMPDAWETRHGLNPDDPADGAKPAADGSGYTHLEIYLNDLAAQAISGK
jgi:pectate lyase